MSRKPSFDYFGLFILKEDARLSFLKTIQKIPRYDQICVFFIIVKQDDVINKTPLGAEPILYHPLLYTGMTYKAYLDNIQAKTEKTPEDLRKLAKEKGLVKYGELLKWLKTHCGLGHGHANAIILYIQNPGLAKRKVLEDAKKRT